MPEWTDFPAVPAEQLLCSAAGLAREYSFACVLFSNRDAKAQQQLLAGFGNFQPGNISDPLQENKTWQFGHLSYDLKSEFENLPSLHADRIGFPLRHFQRPPVIIRQNGNELSIDADGKNESAEGVYAKLSAAKEEVPAAPVPVLKARTTKADYLEKVNRLLQHIHRGDIYEINFCIEYFAENVKADPVEIFLKLNKLTEAPFAALYRCGHSWLLCGSPERFLQKKGSKLISQPIKGTRPRGKTPQEDLQLARELLHDEKERSENVMIVDLVRNDLSRVAARSSVKVDELFGIYSFKTVHQMISTVSAELRPGISVGEIIRATFPMGSMTGAPKIRAMQLAEQYENMRRGLYSGSVGYITPEGDFDFNVVIRSIQYNEKTGYLSLMIGSAITANSDPEKEYAECMVKAESLFRALE